MESTLGDMTIDETGTVSGYAKGFSVYRKRLLVMGLTRGTDITVRRIAPMGDPVEIEVRGFKLSLRKGEARTLIVRNRRQA